MPQGTEIIGPQSKVSLLDQHNELKKKAEGNFNASTSPCITCANLAHKESEKDKQLEEEEKILQNISETRGIQPYNCCYYIKYFMIVHL